MVELAKRARPHSIEFELEYTVGKTGGFWGLCTVVYTVGKNGGFWGLCTTAYTVGNFGGFWGLCATAYTVGNFGGFWALCTTAYIFGNLSRSIHPQILRGGCTLWSRESTVLHYTPCNL